MAKVKVEEVFVYSKQYDRYENSTVKFRIPLALLMEAFKWARTEDKDDEFQDWLDKLEGDNIDYSVVDVLTSVTPYGYTFNEEVNYEKEFKKKGMFGIQVEEATYGVGRTKELAKAAYLLVEDESSGDDDW